MNQKKKLNEIRQRRKKRSRAKIFGTREMPRLSIFRSNQWSYAQLIDDSVEKTIASASTKEIKDKGKSKNKGVMAAHALGKIIAEKALSQGIKKAIFDRGA